MQINAFYILNIFIPLNNLKKRTLLLLVAFTDYADEMDMLPIEAKRYTSS